MSSGSSARRGEPAQAYGSPYGRGGVAPVRPNTTVYQAMERGPALAPELNSGRGAARRGRGEQPQQEPKRGFMRRMFERDGAKPVTSRPAISAPSAPQKVQRIALVPATGAAPVRPARPPPELSPALAVPPELAKARADAARQREQQQRVVIRPENLGTAAAALGSNPVNGAELAQMRKTRNRKTAMVGMPSRFGGVVEMRPGRRAEVHKETLELLTGPAAEPELPVAAPAPVSVDPSSGQRRVRECKDGRRHGSVFDPKALESFPPPVFGGAVAAQHKTQQQKGEEQQQHTKPLPPLPPPSPPKAETGVPTIVVTEPTEAPRCAPAAEGSLLTVAQPFERALRKERTKTRRIVEQVATAWEPVGEVLAGASGGQVEDTTDTEALTEVAVKLAGDSGRYWSLRPGLEMLAEDRRCSPDDEEALTRGIYNVLDVRNQAVAAAAHHKRKSKALEAQLRELVAATGQRPPAR